MSARAILGMDIKGERVARVLVAEAVDIETEYYLAFVTDRRTGRVAAIASAEGGVEIETIAQTDPDKIARADIEPFLGFRAFQARALGRRLGLAGGQLDEFLKIATALYRLYWSEDADLAEINPLAQVGGRLLCVDAKLVVDDNAAYRHPDLPANQEMTELEAEAKRHGLSYVELDGDIAVIGNGAGLVMSTLDLLDHFGGRAANFLDVGGGASAEAMQTALGIVQRKPGVGAVFVNIFGGITACDEVANGIVQALAMLADRGDEVTKPLVVRLDGNNADEGRAILAGAGLHSVELVDTMDGAARRVAELAAAAAS